VPPRAGNEVGWSCGFHLFQFGSPFPPFFLPSANDLFRQRCGEADCPVCCQSSYPRAFGDILVEEVMLYPTVVYTLSRPRCGWFCTRRRRLPENHLGPAPLFVFFGRTNSRVRGQNPLQLCRLRRENPLHLQRKVILRHCMV